MPYALASPYKLFLAICFIVSSVLVSGQPPRMVAYEYIDTYKDLAIGQMILHRIPASVILAQAIFESGSGDSELAKRSNNHFGIKCHLTWEGDTVVKTDDRLDECFRKYDQVRDSYADHSLFLKSRPWYSHLFRLELTDYKGWCKGLKGAGYATHPHYAEELIKIIEQNRLYLFDGVEKLEPKSCVINSWGRIKTSRQRSEPVSARDLARHDLLFSDENDIVIKSLRLLHHQSAEEKVVANP